MGGNRPQLGTYRPTSCQPRADRRRLWSRTGGPLSASLWVTVRLPSRPCSSPLSGGVALAIFFAQSETGWSGLLSLRGHSAGDADRRHRAPASDLSDARTRPCSSAPSWWRSSRSSPTPRSGSPRPITTFSICFSLYGASRWQQLLLLRLPSACPIFSAELRIGGGLALIGAIVAEIAAGSAGQGSGLAFRIVELRLSAEHSAHVRGAFPDLRHRHSHLSVLLTAVSRLAARTVARQRTRPGRHKSAGAARRITRRTRRKHFRPRSGRRSGLTG